MNLAFLTRRYDRVGGTERDLHELTTRLAARGHEIHVYACEFRMEAASGIHLHKIPQIGPGRLARLYSVGVLGPRRAARGNHDLVISYERAVRQDIARCGGGTHKLFLQRMAEKASGWKKLSRALDPYHQMLLRIERQQFAAQNYRRVHAVSESVRAELRSTYGVPDDRIDTVYCGVDTDRFHPDNRTRYGLEVRAELGIPTTDPVVLFLGNGFRRKGLDTLLASIAQAASAPHLLIVGTDAQLPRYRARAKELAIDARTHFVGRQTETWRYYAAADAFVLPSVQEAFGIVVLEAMATGLPCLVSAQAGAAEVLPADMRTHLLPNPQDPAVIAAHIDRVINPDEGKSLGASCRNASLAYSLEEHTRVSEQLFEDLITRSKTTT